MEELWLSKWYRCGRENPVSCWEPRFRGEEFESKWRLYKFLREIPITKDTEADLFLRTFEAIPGTLKQSTCWRMRDSTACHFFCKNLKLSEEFKIMISSLTVYSLQKFCSSKWRIWTIWWALQWLLLHVMRTRSQEWKAHFRPLQRQANFPLEIWIAWLPNRTIDKLKGWCFFSWHSIEDLLKIQVLTVK